MKSFFSCYGFCLFSLFAPLGNKWFYNFCISSITYIIALSILSLKIHSLINSNPICLNLIRFNQSLLSYLLFPDLLRVEIYLFPFKQLIAESLQVWPTVSYIDSEFMNILSLSLRVSRVDLIDNCYCGRFEPEAELDGVCGEETTRLRGDPVSVLPILVTLVGELSVKNSTLFSCC